MINGKFYTGLPEKMMGHSKGPDRQKTNFFWPDESDMEQAVDTRTKLRQKSQKEMTPERSDVKDINPNSLHKNQLSSKISFNDTVDRKPKSPILSVKSVIRPEKNVNIKRRDTFTSKIQFYDFEGDSKPQMVNRNNNSNNEVENNAKNSTKNCDKRISFTENELRDKSPGNRSILKNNETTITNSRINAVKVQPTSRTSSTISKSRSMSDIAAHNKLNVIENNVKNISISQNRNHIYHERDEPDEEFIPSRRPERIPLRGAEPAVRRSRPVNDYYDDGDDGYYYSKHQHFTPQKQHTRTPRQAVRNYEIEAVYDDVYDLPNSRNSAAHQYYSHSIGRQASRREYDEVDDYDYAPRKTSPKPQLRRGIYKREITNFERDISPERRRESTSEIHDIDQKPNNLNHTRNLTNPPPPCGEQQHRAHRHLVSNIDFGSDSANNYASKSIRNSAVTRVSVGLPDS